MNIEKVIRTASAHFSANAKTKEKMQQVLRMYKKAEKQLSEKEKKTASLHKVSKNVKFFVWYYFEYISIRRSNGYTIDLFPNDISKFFDTRIRSVRFVLQGTKKVLKGCDPDHADFWVVEARFGATFKIIAEALNQEAAQDMETFIHDIGRHYKKAI